VISVGCLELFRERKQMNVLDYCDELAVPVQNIFVLAKAKRSVNNENSLTFFFEVPSDYSQSNKKYQTVLWTYTRGAALPPCEMALRDMEDDDCSFTGETSYKSVNIGGIQFASLMKALDPDNDELIREVMTSDIGRVEQICQNYIGLAVETPTSGRERGNDKVWRTQFKFAKFAYSKDPQENTISLEEYRDCFVNVCSEDQAILVTENVRSRITRPDNAVTPEGPQEGDEFLE
jgi:hypothetical protein